MYYGNPRQEQDDQNWQDAVTEALESNRVDDWHPAIASEYEKHVIETLPNHMSIEAWMNKQGGSEIGRMCSEWWAYHNNPNYEDFTNTKLGK
jgi:hypothetical protein